MRTPQDAVNDINYQIRELVSELQNEIDILKEENDKLKEDMFSLTEAKKESK